MDYYPLLYQLHNERRYLIWIGNDDKKDSVAVDASGLIPSFIGIEALRHFSETQHYILGMNEPQLHDLDWIVTWLKSATTVVNCETALTCWNLFSDIATSLPERDFPFVKLDKMFPLIYDKLFYGNNLPSITPEGKHYIPLWSPEEIISLAEVLATGLDMFVSAVRPWPDR